MEQELIETTDEVLDPAATAAEVGTQEPSDHVDVEASAGDPAEDVESDASEQQDQEQTVQPYALELPGILTEAEVEEFAEDVAGFGIAAAEARIPYETASDMVRSVAELASAYTPLLYRQNQVTGAMELAVDPRNPEDMVRVVHAALGREQANEIISKARAFVRAHPQLTSFLDDSGL